MMTSVQTARCLLASLGAIVFWFATACNEAKDSAEEVTKDMAGYNAIKTGKKMEEQLKAIQQQRNRDLHRVLEHE